MKIESNRTTCVFKFWFGWLFLLSKTDPNWNTNTPINTYSVHKREGFVIGSKNYATLLRKAPLKNYRESNKEDKIDIKNIVVNKFLRNKSRNSFIRWSNG